MGSLELNVDEDNMSDQSNNKTDLKGWFSQSSSKRFVALASTVIIALIATLVIINTSSDDDTVKSDLTGLSDLTPESDYLFQPADSLGPDPFTPSFANYILDVPTENLESGIVSGSSTGLYGGTGENACDIDKLVAFLQANPDIGAAWAEVQGIDPSEIEEFIRALTPAILLQNTLVTNHGYSDGEATPFLAVLEAGTAVLVDEDGIPRARCACGNPLIVPEEEEEEEPKPTPTPDEPEILNECPEPNPPYGIHKNPDDEWVLTTEEGEFIWETSLPGWQDLSDPSNVYATELDVPGYIEECFPCPDDSSDSDYNPSYDWNPDGSYRTSDDVLRREEDDRTETYVVIAPKPDSEEVIVEEVDEGFSDDFEEGYDAEKTFEGCFPPCPEEGDWGWSIVEFGSVDEGSLYSGFVWHEPGSDTEDVLGAWSWNGYGWERLIVLDDDPDFGVVYEDYRDLPGWTEDCFECPDWGWVETEDGTWEWHAPDGTTWSYDIMGNWSIIGDIEPISFQMQEDSFEEWTYSPVEDITLLPGFDEDCFECPDWGWVEIQDGSWEWHAPTGQIITHSYDSQNGWVWLPKDYEPGPGPQFSGWSNYKDLPGWSEDCEECPEWGWEQTVEGAFTWIDPQGNTWLPDISGDWYESSSTRYVTRYDDLPGWSQECHCDDQSWGWIDLNNDGILEWQAPDGTIWGEVQGIWLKLDDNLDPVEDYEDSYTWAGDLPGWSDSCFNIPEQTTAQPTPEPTPTPVATPTPVPTPRVTPTPIPDYVAAYIYTDPSCSSLYVGWEPGGGSQLEPEQWHIKVEVDSYLGISVVEKTFPTPITNYPANHSFSVAEFYPNETVWPSGPGSDGRSPALVTVSYQDGGVLRSSAGYQLLLNNCGGGGGGNQLVPIQPYPEQ